jgi:NADP-dependent aldehyde dehydrogenase
MQQPSLITGAILVGPDDRTSAQTFAALNPATGEELEPAFHETTAEQVTEACELAARAVAMYSETPPGERAAFLDCISAEITSLGDSLIERVRLETGLPAGRLEGERARTVGQLGFFARLVRRGDWMDATLDSAEQQMPLPRPQLARRHIALGPVAVFGASNFPLAFSVAGGDTASALAAGCPVVFKGHPAHPGTGELVARAVRAAVERCRMPAGTFSYLPGASHALGQLLVANPRIRGVGFTGSRAAGLALVQQAARRPDPIPVYAEMSSINPVILFPQASRSRGEALAAAYIGSLSLGAGQFCTNPGVLILIDSPDADAFIAAAARSLRECPAQQMLAAGIYAGFEHGVARLRAQSAVDITAEGGVGMGVNLAQPVLLTVRAAQFIADPSLAREVFGPASLIIRAANLQEVVALLDQLEGQLTATLLFDEADIPMVSGLIPRLEQIAGRIVANGWPTGVQVCEAMVHGGPFPATSDGRSTSVGSLAMQRFLRPVCYQNFPDLLLPPALRAGNPLHVPRRMDGEQ